jgi:DNA-directed RNA polymerase I, II, and III subunit RPABC2
MDNKTNYNINDSDDDDDEDIIERLEEKEHNVIVNVDEVYKNINENSKKTLPLLSKFEKARLVGIRKQQLATGSSPCVKGKFLNLDEIIEEEFKQKTLPLIVRRILHNGSYEDWRIEEFKNI